MSFTKMTHYLNNPLFGLPSERSPQPGAPPPHCAQNRHTMGAPVAALHTYFDACLLMLTRNAMHPLGRALTLSWPDRFRKTGLRCWPQRCPAGPPILEPRTENGKAASKS